MVRNRRVHPDAVSFAAVTAARPAQLPPTELVDMIVTTEKLISHLHALQIGAVAEFARPGRAGDLTGLIDLLTEKGGQAKLPDGTINIDALETLVKKKPNGWPPPKSPPPCTNHPAAPPTASLPPWKWSTTSPPP